MAVFDSTGPLEWTPMSTRKQKKGLTQVNLTFWSASFHLHTVPDHLGILKIPRVRIGILSDIHGEIGPPEPAAIPGRAGPLLEEVPGVQGLRDIFQPEGPSVDAVPL